MNSTIYTELKHMSFEVAFVFTGFSAVTIKVMGGFKTHYTLTYLTVASS